MEAKRQDIGMDIDENKKEETQKSTSAVREILSWVLTFALAIGAAFLIKNYLIINADVPTGSMENTIMPGDRLIGNRLAFLKDTPERGDVVIFHYPDDEEELYVKRVIGLPGEEFVQKIDQIVMAHEEICGIHDLIVHDYGPGRQMVSLHAEVPAEGNILEIHDIIDNVENELKEKLGCDATIHMDPIVTSDEHVSEMKAAVISIIKGIDERINMHDFRVVTGPTHTNIIFDVLIPYKFQIQDDELAARITSQVRERLGNNYYVVIKVDHSYV